MADELKPIRTFESDIASSVRSNQGSVVHIALAEEEKRRSQETVAHGNKKSVLFGTLGLVLIIASCALVGIAIYTTEHNSPKPVPIPEIKKEGLFTAGHEYVFALATSTTRMETIAELQKTVPTQTLGDISRVVITVAGTTTPIALDDTDFLSVLLPKAPDLFKRSLAPLFEYGVYQDTTPKPFLIFTSIDYDRSYAGLLAWERDMKSEFSDLFNNAPENTTINTSDETTQPVVHSLVFKDTVVKNVELRVLLDENGTEYLVYGFPRRNTLIIAPNTKTFFIVRDALR